MPVEEPLEALDVGLLQVFVEIEPGLALEPITTGEEELEGDISLPSTSTCEAEELVGVVVLVVGEVPPDVQEGGTCDWLTTEPAVP